MRAARRSSIGIVASVQQQRPAATAGVKGRRSGGNAAASGLDGVGAEQFPGRQLVGYGTEGHRIVAVIAGGFQAAEGGRKVDVALAGGRWTATAPALSGRRTAPMRATPKASMKPFMPSGTRWAWLTGMPTGSVLPEAFRGDGVEKVAAFVNGYGPGNGLRRRPARG